MNEELKSKYFRGRSKLERTKKKFDLGQIVAIIVYQLVIRINELLRMQRCWTNDALNEEANINAHNLD